MKIDDLEKKRRNQLKDKLLKKTKTCDSYGNNVFKYEQPNTQNQYFFLNNSNTYMCV